VGLLVAAVISGYPARWFRGSHELQLKSSTERPPLSDFTLPAIQGGKWRLSDHAGKVILLNFWATWCNPCRAETPELVRLYDRYRSHGFEIAGISLDEDPDEVVPQFLRQYDVRYPVLLPPQDFALARYVESLPTTLIIDRSGRVAGSWIGRVHEEELVPAIERLLGEK
jgi:cytochrome c biogenesis protein CcmG/thiol:disulfide interchange protein DsbE